MEAGNAFKSHLRHHPHDGIPIENSDSLDRRVRDLVRQLRFVPVPRPWGLAMGLLSLLLFFAVVLVQTLRSGPITLHRIQGAVAAYLLLGVLWAYAYALVEALRPGAFSGPISGADGPRALLYFSFVTLTTTGYGDVLPVRPAARSLANLEAVTGTLFVAILVARLVSLAVSPGAGGRGHGGDR